MNDRVVLETIISSKGEYSIYEENGKKYFQKKIYSNIVPEVEGYNLIRFYYDLPRLIEYNLMEQTIIYEYNEGLRNKTLHHALFNDIPFDINKIIDLMTFRFKDFEFKNENLSVNSKFFIGRIKDVINYLDTDDKLYDYNLIFKNHQLGNFRNVVKSIIAGISKNQVVPFVISQGDPTDLNFSIDYKVTDFEVAGKNSIINEVAIFVGCYIVNCYYFYIKYMKSPHAQFKDTLDNFKNYVRSEYAIDDKKINISFHNIIPANVKELILKYLERVKNIGIIHKNFDLGIYIALRFISPVNLNNIDNEEDKIILMTLSALFAKKYKTLNDVIKFVKEM